MSLNGAGREDRSTVRTDEDRSTTHPAGRASDRPAGRPPDRPDLFARNTLRREYEDVRAVVQFVAGGGVADVGAGGGGPALGLYGHSRGAVAAVLNAIEHPCVRALCTWSTSGDPDFYTRNQKERWRRDGEYAFTDIDGTSMAVGLDYLNDLEANHSFYLLEERVRELRVPHLIVHGDADVVIQVENAHRLYDAETNLVDKRLVTLKTGHTFGVPYPAPDSLQRIPRALEQAADETVDWFARYVANGGQE
jgi:dipeptidyl aminopeptidase/acylaminoacyl peptidase